MKDECVGPYRLLRELGRGQSGAVYEAQDSRDGKVVALKVLEIGDDVGSLGAFAPRTGTRLIRFLRETDTVRRLVHPNIVGIIDAGADGDRLFIAMECLQGETLRVRLSRGATSPEETVTIGTQIAAALEAAHSQGIVHRDVKPDNIFLCEDGQAKLMDFGAARISDEFTLTQTGSAIGSPAYMAPEQVSGERCDARTDVWGLAVTLYESIAGEKPFNADSVASVLYAIVQKQPDYARVPSQGIARVLERGLAKKPAARYPSATAFAAGLQTALTEPVVPPPFWSRFAASLPGTPGGRKLALGGAAVFLGGILGALTLITLYMIGTPSERDQPIAAPSPIGRKSLPAVAAPSAAVAAPTTPGPAAAPSVATAPPAPAPRKAPVVTVVERPQPRPAVTPRPAVNRAPTVPADTRPPVIVATTTVEKIRRPEPPQDQPQPEPKRSPAPEQPVVSTPPGDREAESIYHPAPRLTPSLRGFRGEVRLRVKVNASGEVESVEIASGSGNAEADDVAVEAASNFEYEPAYRHGRPVASEIVEEIAFGG